MNPSITTRRKTDKTSDEFLHEIRTKTEEHWKKERKKVKQTEELNIVPGVTKNLNKKKKDVEQSSEESESSMKMSNNSDDTQYTERLSAEYI